MTLDEIMWMYRLFETRNMTKAADSLFISQPALSQALRRVENELGFPLFNRSNKGLVPTEKGLLFEETAKTIYDTYRDFRVKAILADRTELKEIVIGLPPFLSACISAELLEQLDTAFPEIHFSVEESYSDQLAEALRSGNIQLAVTSGRLALPGGKIRSFGRGRIVILLRKGSPVEEHVFIKNGFRYLDPRYLEGEPLAMTKTGQATRLLAENLMKEAGINPDVRQETRRIETLYRYAEKGIATAVAPLLWNGEERDKENHLICRIPESYKGAYYSSCIAVLAETEKLIPERVFEIIRKKVTEASGYAMQA